MVLACFIFNLKELLKIKSLKDAKIFETVVVEKITGDRNLRNRIMELGITKGVKIYVKNFAPMRSPIKIFVRGYNLCLGINEAENIKIKN